jgi:hypothetical protein
MKLITNSRRLNLPFLIIITAFLFCLVKGNLQKPEEVVDTSLKPSKYLFMYKYPLVKNEPNHKLNSFTYKNILFSEDQVVYFESTNESDQVSSINIQIYFL